MLDYPQFKKLVSELTGVDLSNYKSQQMDRRINYLKQLWNLETYDDYLQVLKTDPYKFELFVNRLTINVSEFYRNPERYAELHQYVLPELLRKSERLKIWSAGCSNGAEPYSVAIIANELRARERVQIIATDIDKEILKRAREGVYTYNDLKNLPPEFIRKYFNCQNDLYYFHEDLKKIVEFRFQDLLLDEFETNWDLIICRNVVIYFTEEAKKKLYKRFNNSLKPGGYLLVGGTEPILDYRNYHFTNPFNCIYQKLE
ncbi:MAG: protein-glutamate O-methyltransferase CheR [Firmicutes bacterium]|nr:protein-glutamate O-methyltransferase CheR [Bacillota bacterium]